MVEKDIHVDIDGKTYCGTQIIYKDKQIIKYKSWSKIDYEIYTTDTICNRDAIAEIILREIIIENTIG